MKHTKKINPSVFFLLLFLLIIPFITSSPDILNDEPLFILDELSNRHFTNILLLHTPLLTNDTVILNTLSLFVEETRIIDDIPFVKVTAYIIPTPNITTKNITYSRWNITDFDENGNRIQYTLDGFGQISNVTERYVDPFIFINESYVTSYRYDTNGNLIKITDSLSNQFKFGYNSLNRKISMDDPDLGIWLYRYDQNGNLISQSGGGGNLVSGDGYYREYNNFGQLVKVRNGSSAASPLLEEYTYDYSGQRIKIKRNDSANTNVYTPFRELMRIVNSSGSYDFTYVYDGGTLVARINPDGSKQYEHTDHLGSTSVITNQNGNVIENTSYTPYGEELTGGDKDVKGYTGQFDDEATGQMYYGARYYKPGTAQFVSPDPIINNVYTPQNLNHYSYVLNNPYKYVDPNGLWAVVVGIGSQGVLGHVAGGFEALPIAISYSNDYGFEYGLGLSPSVGTGEGLEGQVLAGSGMFYPDVKRLSELNDYSIEGEVSGFLEGGGGFRIELNPEGDINNLKEFRKRFSNGDLRLNPVGYGVVIGGGVGGSGTISASKTIISPIYSSRQGILPSSGTGRINRPLSSQEKSFVQAREQLRKEGKAVTIKNIMNSLNRKK